MLIHSSPNNTMNILSTFIEHDNVEEAYSYLKNRKEHEIRRSLGTENIEHDDGLDMDQLMSVMQLVGHSISYLNTKVIHTFAAMDGCPTSSAAAGFLASSSFPLPPRCITAAKAAHGRPSESIDRRFSPAPIRIEGLRSAGSIEGSRRACTLTSAAPPFGTPPRPSAS